MKIKPAVIAAAAAAALGMSGAPLASADAEVQYLGQPGELVNGSVVQHWTITGLKPSSDVIPYQPAGTLWEATATDEAIAGSVTPIVSNLNARARNGDTYRVLFTVATPQGVNPSTLAQGEKTTGKIYFDV
ncbi:MAG: MPT63 family protein, partial [Actinomycetota bacterium]